MRRFMLKLAACAALGVALWTTPGIAQQGSFYSTPTPAPTQVRVPPNYYTAPFYTPAPYLTWRGYVTPAYTTYFGPAPTSYYYRYTTPYSSSWQNVPMSYYPTVYFD